MQVIELERGATRATVVPEAGGRLLQIEIHDRGAWLPLLVAPSDLQSLLDEPLAWGCYPMTPWPGRVDGSRFTWRDQSHDLPANSGAHSIHGRGVYMPWAATDVNDASCALTLTLGPESGWPWPAQMVQTIRVFEDGVALRLEVHAGSDAPFPAGVGWHPWFRRDLHPGAEPTVRVPATVHYQRRADLIPTGVVGAPASDADLRDGPMLGTRLLDDFYGGVSEPMRVTWGDLTLTMTSSANCIHAVAYTGSERGFCVEPQTCVPDAFNLDAHGTAGTGIAVVEPGRPLIAETTWRWSMA